MHEKHTLASEENLFMKTVTFSHVDAMEFSHADAVEFSPVDTVEFRFADIQLNLVVLLKHNLVMWMLWNQSNGQWNLVKWTKLNSVMGTWNLLQISSMDHHVVTLF